MCAFMNVCLKLKKKIGWINICMAKAYEWKTNVQFDSEHDNGNQVEFLCADSLKFIRWINYGTSKMAKALAIII